MIGAVPHSYDVFFLMASYIESVRRRIVQVFVKGGGGEEGERGELLRCASALAGIGSQQAE